LSVNYGFASPDVLHFTNGVGSAENNCVKIYGQGGNKQLVVQGRGWYGESGYFSSGTGYCVGRVEVHAYTSGATVILDEVSGGEYSRRDTNYTHIAAFNNVPCNSYTVRVEKDGHSYEENKPLNVVFSGNTYVRAIHLPESGAKTPVVLIPGIMGSTNRGASGLEPYFKGNYPDKDIVIHLPHITGWSTLKKQLEENGHPVVLCPSDWRSESRESMKKNVETFLIPAINNALNYTPGTKVDIVAHSMGGLLARAYIQSDEYRNDVSRLALVAVPNLGSANPYCLIEAGDTKTTKAFVGGFYEETIKKLWKKTYHKKHWKSCKAGKIRDFLHDYGPGVYQLMFTGDFLKDNNTEYGVMQGDNVNTWLKAMNDGTNGFKSPGSVFEKPDESGNKVKARVFAGKLSDQETLRWIKTDGAASSLYPDGQPLDYRSCSPKGKGSPTHVIWGDGDGTVPWGSAVYPVAEGWADGLSKTGSRKHAFIMKDFKNEIKDFLDVVTPTNAIAGKSLAFVKKDGVKGAADLTPELMFSMIGNMRLVVTDSQGRKSGIPAATGEMVNEIPETDIEANDAGMQITISNSSSGQYSLDYYGVSDGDYSLYVTAYDTSGEGYEDSFDGYRPDHPQSLVVSYDSANADHTTIQPMVKVPSDFESEPYDCATGKCARLLWKASEGAGVTGYVIYRSLSDEPFYTEMARVAASVTSYNTGEAWDNAEGYPVNGYGVSAIKADETESFFAKEKKDVMHIFPWPMFLPAINAGK